MNTATRAIALTTAGAVIGTPLALLAATPAHADVDRSGSCGTGRYELSVDREGRGYEIAAELDRVQPGSRWKVVLRHDGKKFTSTTRTADREGDLEVERYRNGTSGSEKFKATFKRVGGGSTCGTTITAR